MAIRSTLNCTVLLLGASLLHRLPVTGVRVVMTILILAAATRLLH